MGGRTAGAPDPDVGRRRLVFGDRTRVAVLPRLHQSMAASIHGEALGRTSVATPLATAQCGHHGDGSADSREDAAASARWHHALEHTETGAPAANQSQPRGERVAGAGLQPHRFERYMQSDDPDFERKAADVIGLYINPPQHAAVFAVDEKTAIQALDRLDPILPLSPGRAERHGFE